MFRRTERQIPLLGASARLPDSSRRRLEKSWADPFRAKVYPRLLDGEREFAALYDEGNGRPNWSVARKLGVCVLQDMLDLDDQSALDALAFDVRWQHALDLGPEEAYLSRRSLVDFRGRLVECDPEMTLMRGIFERIGQAALDDLGLSAREQRLDSTFITSNIRTRGRLDLFQKTLRQCLDWMASWAPSKLERLGAPLRDWYSEPVEGYFGKPKQSELRAKLEGVAQWLVEVLTTFAADRQVSESEAYQLVERLVGEHCERIAAPSDDGSGTPGATGTESTEALTETVPEQAEASAAAPDAGAEPETVAQPEANLTDEIASDPDVEPESPPESTVRVLDAPINGGASLQSPFDPDAGYGHKGKGYLVQIAETCGNDSTEIITDFAVQPSNETDQGKSTEALDRLAPNGLAPDVLYADAGYASGQAFAAATERGVCLAAPVPNHGRPDDALGRHELAYDSDGTLRSCAAGHVPSLHRERTGSGAGGPTLHASFDAAVCRACPLLGRCPVQVGATARLAHLDVSAAAIARDAAIAAQTGPHWWDDYRLRTGIEATNSELKRAHGLGRLRVRGRPRVLLAVASKLTACNIKRWIRAAIERVGLDVRPSAHCEPRRPLRSIRWLRLHAIGHTLRRLWSAWMSPPSGTAMVCHA